MFLSTLFNYALEYAIMPRKTRWLKLNLTTTPPVVYADGNLPDDNIDTIKREKKKLTLLRSWCRTHKT
jgi:hypothetical protein